MAVLDARKMRNILVDQGATPEDAAAIVGELGDVAAMDERLGRPVGTMSVRDYFSALGYTI